MPGNNNTKYYISEVECKK